MDKNIFLSTSNYPEEEFHYISSDLKTTILNYWNYNFFNLIAESAVRYKLNDNRPPYQEVILTLYDKDTFDWKEDYKEKCSKELDTLVEYFISALEKAGFFVSKVYSPEGECSLTIIWK